MRVKMADVCEDLAEHERDDFDDDYEVEGTLRFSYNDKVSILPYDGDEFYGSNYELMINVRDWLKSDSHNNQVEIYLECNNLDDGQTWAHDKPTEFDGIIVCHTTCQFIRDFGYPIVDFLHLNDFWSEVHVRFQHFSTQDANFKYPRD